jgi:salicylate hydroxylase
MNTPLNSPTLPFVVVGGGMGGLASALALSRGGRQVVLLERAAQFGEVGAGIQLGPNAVAVLAHWGLLPEYLRVACQPPCIAARDLQSGRELARLDLQGMGTRYGQPYTSVHRADLHGVLLRAASGVADLRLDASLTHYEAQPEAVNVHWESAAGQTQQTPAAALIGADGVWSRVRAQLLGDGLPTRTGHVAYRGLIDMAQLPAKLRAQHITVWMGARLHAVVYPVKAGQALNVVLVSAGQVLGDAQSWSAKAPAEQLAHITAQAHPQLQDLLQAVSHLQSWQMWALHDRAPIAAAQYANGRVALLGDAAHPMRPYLAQGAAMALEDAAVLGRCVAQEAGVEQALGRYAQERWARNARVQTTAQRNGKIFHAKGLLRMGRNLALQVAGEKLMDSAWLYGRSVVAQP